MVFPKCESLLRTKILAHMLFGGETSRIGELFIDVSPPFLRVEIELAVL